LIIFESITYDNILNNMGFWGFGEQYVSKAFWMLFVQLRIAIAALTPGLGGAAAACSRRNSKGTNSSLKESLRS
jgi:hypothetical protein